MKNRKNYVIVLGTTFIFGTVVGWIAQGKPLNFVFTYYVPALATLLAAYFGAKYAFDFQRNKEIEDIKRKNIVNGNVIIFNLMEIINSLLTYQRQIIDPVRSKPSAFIEMSPTTHLSDEEIQIDLSRIYFILETENVNLPGEISVGISKYKKALDAINQRSVTHIHELQPALEKANLQPKTNYSLKQLEDAIGSRLFTTMIESTKNIITHIDQTLIYLKDVTDKLTLSLKQQFPGEKILNITIPDDPEV